jgi:hypothetical protein
MGSGKIRHPPVVVLLNTLSRPELKDFRHGPANYVASRVICLWCGKMLKLLKDIKQLKGVLGRDKGYRIYTGLLPGQSISVVFKT